MDTTEWLDKLTTATTRDIAKRAGISERTLQHQVKAGKLSMENVALIAAAYSVHPLRALIDTGFIDPAWARVPDVEAALKIATDEQLTNEILRRLEGTHAPVYDTPIDELPHTKSDYGLAASRRVKETYPEHPEDPA